MVEEGEDADVEFGDGYGDEYGDEEDEWTSVKE